MFERPNYTINYSLKSTLVYIKKDSKTILSHCLHKHEEILSMLRIRLKVLRNHGQGAWQNNLNDYQKYVQHFSLKNNQTRGYEKYNLWLFYLHRLVLVNFKRKQNQTLKLLQKLLMITLVSWSYNALQQVNNVLSNTSEHLYSYEVQGIRTLLAEYFRYYF
jgi:valyl-tRNA synthetase